MAERLLQKDGQEVPWPHLESAENLPPLEEDYWKALFLYEIRRIRNMPPPTVREVGEFIGRDSSSSARYVVEKLTREGFLTKHEGHEKTATSRSTVIRVNFLTVRRETIGPIQIVEVPGLTYPNVITERDRREFQL